MKPRGLPDELREPAPPPPTGEWKRTDTMARSIEVRVPTFTGDDSPAFKVDQLEQWVLGTAAIAGALSKERLEAHEQLAEALHVWDELAAGFGKSQQEARKAKAMLRPDLDVTIRHRRWLIDRLSEEIDRLEREYAKVSRAYTMLAGT